MMIVVHTKLRIYVFVLKKSHLKKRFLIVFYVKLWTPRVWITYTLGCSFIEGCSSISWGNFMSNTHFYCWFLILAQFCWVVLLEKIKIGKCQWKRDAKWCQKLTL